MARPTAIVYRELRQRATANLERERRDHALHPTAPVQAAYIRLVGQKQFGGQIRKVNTKSGQRTKIHVRPVRRPSPSRRTPWRSASESFALPASEPSADARSPAKFHRRQSEQRRYHLFAKRYRRRYFACVGTRAKLSSFPQVINNAKFRENSLRIRDLQDAERVGFESLLSVENKELTAILLPHDPLETPKDPGRRTYCARGAIYWTYMA